MPSQKIGSACPATAISADGPLNLLNAVRTAISPDAKGKGTLIVLNDEINSLVLGKEREVRLAFTTLLAGGHLLIEDLDLTGGWLHGGHRRGDSRGHRAPGGGAPAQMER